MVQSNENVTKGKGEKEKKEDALVVVEAVGMWSGSVSVSCPHVHSQRWH